LFGGDAYWATITTSLLFGCAHGLDPGVVIVTGAIGLFLAFVVRLSGGNLALAMILHALQDSIAFTFGATQGA
jgi:membrane protease YdiL (CAAX protease family)